MTHEKPTAHFFTKTVKKTLPKAKANHKELATWQYFSNLHFFLIFIGEIVRIDLKSFFHLCCEARLAQFWRGKFCGEYLETFSKKVLQKHKYCWSQWILLNHYIQKKALSFRIKHIFVCPHINLIKFTIIN